MTTGVSIYLVSACTSGEQFVAAFRRYADKNGLFIPIASPIPAGRRGRFALTLSDGGVMIEGVADIVSAATTPSILHGRVGMTLRFSELDVASKTVLLELEQARLALKPQPPSVPPRPAAVPAEPRAKVPTPSGRVDANNARAECVAIGDIDALEQTVPQVPKPGGKFAIPSIPPVSGARTKAPSMVPTPKEIGPARPTKPTVPPVVRPQVPTPIDVSPARAPMHATPLSITAIDAPIVMPDEEPTQPPHLVRDAAANPTLDEELGPVPQVADAELFAGPTRDTETLAAAVPTDVPSDQPSGSGRVRRGGNTQSSGKLLRAATQIGLPIVQSKTPAQPSGAQPRPPVVADPTPSLAMPELSDEPTDVTSVPIVIPDGREDASTESSPVPGGGRKTVIGVAVVPEGVTVLPAIAAPISAPSLTAPPLASAPAVGAPVIEEPTGDWTMIPGEPPRILPRATARDEAAADEPTSPPVLPPTGNWTIAPVANSPDGWSEPSKVDLAPIRANVRSNVGPPVAMVSGEKALEVTSTAKHFDIEEETKAGVKIEVDASLAASELDLAHESTQFAPPPALRSAVGGPNALRPLPAAPAPHGGASSGGYPSPSSSAPGHLYSVGDSTSVLVATRKKRAFVIAASAAAAVVLGIVLLIVFGLGDTPKPAANGPSAPVLAPSPDAAQPAITDAAVLPDPQRVRATGAPADAAPARSECVVEISSLPTGAEVVRGKEVVGTTPTKLTLPCGQEAKLVVRKGKFAGVTRAVTPIDAATVLKVKVALAKTLLSVKVTSSPPGATITSGGKSLGVTPAMIKLPALEPSTLVISKPGFTAETQKLTPKQNNQAVHVALKRRGR